ncbi:MAG: hypothetical protein WCS75_00645 [Sphingomonas sp.]
MPFLLIALCCGASAASASELVGPGRFCGYSPIIDLEKGERITPLQGGIHGGSFRWEGGFGTLEVLGIGWAAPPTGPKLDHRSSAGAMVYRPRFDDGRYRIAIWNGRAGAAYFSSPTPFTAAQMAAIDRVALFQEGEDPGKCNLRTVFSWE